MFHQQHQVNKLSLEKSVARNIVTVVHILKLFFLSNLFFSLLISPPLGLGWYWRLEVWKWVISRTYFQVDKRKISFQELNSCTGASFLRKSATLLKKRLQYQCFFENFVKILRKPFYRKRPDKMLCIFWILDLSTAFFIVLLTTLSQEQAKIFVMKLHVVTMFERDIVRPRHTPIIFAIIRL